MANSSIPLPSVERLPFPNPDDLRRRSGRLLLDEFAVLAMCPPDMALEAAPLLAAIREELLRRLEQVQP